jgi:hypothetical protein
MRKLTKHEIAALPPHAKKCGWFECSKPATHWNEFTGRDDNEVYCAQHAKEADADNKKHPNYPPRNTDGTVRLPDCIVEAKRKLANDRHRRADKLRTDSLGPWLRSKFLSDVAYLMDKLNISEEAARYKLHREMGIRHQIALTLSLPTIPKRKIATD